MLTGGDYISSFFKTSKQTLNGFIENIEHICDGETFVDTVGNSDGNRGVYVT